MVLLSSLSTAVFSLPQSPSPWKTNSLTCLSIQTNNHVVCSILRFIVDHQAIDLVEKPVGSSLSITQPAAVIRSSQAIGKPLKYNEIPQLVFNNDHSKLAIVFEKTSVVVLYSVTLQNDSIELSPLSELKNITSFAWSYIPTKYATIENKLLYISVCLPWFILVVYQ